MSTFVHPTAIIEDHVQIGEGTRIWHYSHVRGPSSIGKDCIVGGSSYIAYDVNIGDRVKINNSVYICTSVSIEHGAMISAGTIFTNDRFPRACGADLAKLLPSEPNQNTRPTRVREGATIGAGCVVGCDLIIGRFAMVGMGSVVTKDVPDYGLVLGNPARLAGFVTRGGQPWLRFSPGMSPENQTHTCVDGYVYELRGGQVQEA